MPFVELTPKRTVNIGGTLGDVDGQLDAGHPYKDSDRVTWCHEGTHGVNSRIRNEHDARNGLYCLKGRAFVIPTNPPFKLNDVAQAIPQEKRGRSFKLYLIDQQRYWNDDPLYVIDELTAYTNGAIAGFELGMTDRAVHSRDNAKEFWRYSRAAQRLARDRGYAEQDALDEFMEWYHREVFSPLLKA